jgi:hypothetical protein
MPRFDKAQLLQYIDNICGQSNYWMTHSRDRAKEIFTTFAEMVPDFPRVRYIKTIVDTAPEEQIRAELDILRTELVAGPPAPPEVVEPEQEHEAESFIEETPKPFVGRGRRK